MQKHADDPSIVYLLLTENTRQDYCNGPRWPFPPVPGQGRSTRPFRLDEINDHGQEGPRPTLLFILSQLFRRKQSQNTRTAFQKPGDLSLQTRLAKGSFYRTFGLWAKEEIVPIAKREMRSVPNPLQNWAWFRLPGDIDSPVP